LLASSLARVPIAKVAVLPYTYNKNKRSQKLVISRVHGKIKDLWGLVKKGYYRHAVILKEDDSS